MAKPISTICPMNSHIGHLLRQDVGTARGMRKGAHEVPGVGASPPAGGSAPTAALASGTP